MQREPSRRISNLRSLHVPAKHGKRYSPWLSRRSDGVLLRLVLAVSGSIKVMNHCVEAIGEQAKRERRTGAISVGGRRSAPRPLEYLPEPAEMRRLKPVGTRL